MTENSPPSWMRLGAIALTGMACAPAAPARQIVSSDPPTAMTCTTVCTLAGSLAVGDVVFIRIKPWPFREVAAATGSWTNHVGVVVETGGPDPMVAESAVPWSRKTTLSQFVARSAQGRLAVLRLAQPLSDDEALRLQHAAEKRLGVGYDTGFDLHSRRQFCSRFVREVIQEATGTALGDVERLEELLARQPQANLGFWRLWYFGRIPWQRETVTPASLLRSPLLVPVFDGVAGRGRRA